MAATASAYFALVKADISSVHVSVLALSIKAVCSGHIFAVAALCQLSA